MKVVFVTGAETDAGKTSVTRGLAAALVSRETKTLAVKPFETGCDPDPKDALLLERACGHAGLAHRPAFFRASAPVAPYAASIAGSPVADFDAIQAELRALAATTELLLVEGAGGLLVPIDATHTIADLARALRTSLILVLPNRLGVLSNTHALVIAAASFDLAITAIVLNRVTPDEDASVATNARILREKHQFPVLEFPFLAGASDADLAAACVASGLLALIER